MSELFSYGPRGIREFLRVNLVPILYTIIIHLVVAIILVLLKVEGLKEDQELGVMLDFTEEQTLEEMLEEENVQVPEEWLQQVYERREKASNIAVNIEDKVNEEISTSDYVDDLLDELESQKDEEFVKDREKWKEIISSYVYEEDKPKIQPEASEEENVFSGPTTITYEFLNEPKSRKKRSLTIPVYRCEGAALVVIDIEVLRDGTVTGTDLVSVETVNDPACFIKAAELAARTSRFFSSPTAPQKHVARVTYQFIAQ